MDISLIIGLGGTLIAIVSILIIHLSLRPPVVVMGGTMKSRYFCDGAMQRLKIASLVAIALLPMEGAERIVKMAPDLTTIASIEAHSSALLIAFAFILCPLVLVFLFRRFVARLATRKTVPFSGFNSIIGAYAVLTVVMPFASIALINQV